MPADAADSRHPSQNTMTMGVPGFVRGDECLPVKTSPMAESMMIAISCGLHAVIECLCFAKRMLGPARGADMAR